MDSTSAMWAHSLNIVFSIIATIFFILALISIYKEHKKKKVFSNKDKYLLCIWVGSMIGMFANTLFRGNDLIQIILLGISFTIFAVVPLVLLLKAAFRTNKK